MKRLGLIFLFLLGCQTTQYQPFDPGKVYFGGEGIAKFHPYGRVAKCRTAFGLDPAAFGGMVTAVSTRIHERFPAMTTAGKRGGPYDPKARCIRVKGVESGESVTLRAVDKCCGKSLSNKTTHQLDMAEEAFVKIGPKAKGNLRVTWALVDCPNELQIQSDSAICDDDYYFTP